MTEQQESSSDGQSSGNSEDLRLDVQWPFRAGLRLSKSLLAPIWPSVARHVIPAVGRHIIPAIAKYFVPAVSISLIVYSLFYGLSLLFRK